MAKWSVYTHSYSHTHTSIAYTQATDTEGDGDVSALSVDDSGLAGAQLADILKKAVPAGGMW